MSNKVISLLTKRIHRGNAIIATESETRKKRQDPYIQRYESFKLFRRKED